LSTPGFGLVFIRPYETLKFLVFFFAGLYLFYHQDLLTRLVSNVLFNLFIVCGFWFALPWITPLNTNPIVQMAQSIYAINISLLLFWFSFRFFNQRREFI